MPDHALSSMTDAPFDRIRREDEHGEYWTGRDLMGPMEYLRWEKFADVIEKAKTSLALVQGVEQAEHHFAIWGRDGGRWGNQRLDDYRLTRFGAYLVAMAGDDTKKAVAEARIYFAVKTREAEVAPTRQLPRSYAEALRELAGEVEAHEQTKARVIELEPDAARARQTLDADGLSLVRTVAKRFGIKEKALREFLYAEKILIRGGSCHNEPMARYVQGGHFEVKATHIETHPDLPAQLKSTTYVTPKGEALIWKRLYEAGYVSTPVMPPEQLQFT
jgi:phage antirepressor YoqD-like protein